MGTTLRPRQIAYSYMEPLGGCPTPPHTRKGPYKRAPFFSCFHGLVLEIQLRGAGCFEALPLYNSTPLTNHHFCELLLQSSLTLYSNYREPTTIMAFVVEGQILEMSREVAVGVYPLLPTKPYRSMSIYGIYLGLKVVPVSLLLGLCMYYIGTWTHWVFTYKSCKT